MIQKIDIGKFGQFDSFVWNTCCGNDYSFKKMNILYGRNYSGKTTLSRVFRCIEKSTLDEKYCDAAFSIRFDDNRVIHHSAMDTLTNELKIRVYNSDFVKENLSWLHNADGSIEPFTILGETNVTINKEVEKIELLLGSVEAKSGLLWELECLKETSQKQKDTYEEAKTDLENKLRNKAIEIKNDGVTFNSPLYNINSIRADIPNNPEDAILNEQDNTDKRKLIRESPKRTIEKILEKESLLPQHISKTKSLVEKKIKINELIQELISDTILQQWVLNGIDLHKDKRTTCGFCGGILNENIWEKLNSHFNKESQDLRGEIANHKILLEKAKNAIVNLVTLNRDLFYHEFQSEYDRLYHHWQVLVEEYKKGIDEMLLALGQRDENIFAEQTAPTINDCSAALLASQKEINSLIEKNNDRTNSLAEAQQEARAILKISEVATFAKHIEYHKALANVASLERIAREATDRVKEKKFEIDTYAQKIEGLLAQANDEKRGADLINRHLSSFFGHSQLKLVAVEDENTIKFKIYRGSDEAFNLSEGETSLISFCYFIAKMEDELNDPLLQNQLVIYIDDPISSLDSNHVFFMFSLIDCIIVKEHKYAQLFISTHSLDFLKYLKRLPTPGKKQVGHFLIESRGNGMRRKSFILPMPHHLKEFVTEFNYLFSEIHKVYNYTKNEIGKRDENLYSQTYNFSNNLRKFLECYLFYKYPNTNEPLKKLEKLFDQNIPPLLNRIVNEYSHLTQLERGLQPLEFHEIELCAEIVLKKIYEKDHEQYTALCESVGILTELQIRSASEITSTT